MPDIELLSLVNALENHKVDYVIIGGMALLIHGAGIVTRDIDLSIAFDKNNLAHLAVALNEFEPRLRNGARINLDVHAFGGEFTTIYTNAGIIQIVNRLNGFKTYAELTAQTVTLTIHGVAVKVANLDALQAMKESTGRDKDKLHLELIQSLKKRQQS